jgi:hypothetical protein
MSPYSTEVQAALSEFKQVEVLLEMMIDHFAGGYVCPDETDGFEKLLSASLLLADTYKTKSEKLFRALKGGSDDD